jgi:hypothetical protein
MTIYKLQSQPVLKQLKVLSFESLTGQMHLIRHDSEIWACPTNQKKLTLLKKKTTNK